jgi:hypothetical protein
VVRRGFGVMGRLFLRRRFWGRLLGRIVSY